MALTKIDDRGLTTPIDLLDDEKIRFGTTDNDLEIFHGSNISTIKDGKGDLRIMSDTIRIQRNAGGENYIYATEGGAVKLYYDGGDPKLETTSEGTATTGRATITATGSAGKPTLTLGAVNSSGSLALTDSTSKAARIGVYHYTNAEEPIAVLYPVSTDANNQINYGGGTSYMNAATHHKFFTATDGTTNTTTGTEKVRIMPDGKVGIGTGAPDRLLHLYESSTTQTPSTESQLVLEKNANSGITILSGQTTNGRILFGDSGDNDIGQIDYDHNDDSLRFVAGAVERMRLGNDGKVYFGDYLDAATRAYIHSDGDDPWALTISASNSTSTDRGIVFRLRPGHKAAEFATTGHLKFPDGHGIDFGETEGPNSTSTVLDDYEEGHWDLSGAKCNVDLHDNYDRGWYVKVGHMVNCGAYVQSDETSTDTTTSLTFTLPFATSAVPSGGDTGWIGGCSTNSFALSANMTQTNIAAGDAAATASIRQSGGATGWVNLRLNQFADGKLMQFTLTYKCQ
tara:strand:+ start:15502 stop:17037 length:1536 start_codon:yes stop_codon:yes gene_type:complete